MAHVRASSLNQHPPQATCELARLLCNGPPPCQCSQLLLGSSVSSDEMHCCQVINTLAVCISGCAGEGKLDLPHTFQRGSHL